MGHNPSCKRKDFGGGCLGAFSDPGDPMLIAYYPRQDLTAWRMACKLINISDSPKRIQPPFLMWFSWRWLTMVEKSTTLGIIESVIRHNRESQHVCV
jgi:hypothetical protein